MTPESGRPAARPAPDAAPLVRRVPQALVALRAACAPAIVLGAVTGWAGGTLAAVVTVAFLSDVFDGIVARRLGVATEGLRRADTIVDTVFYAAAAIALWARAPGIVRANRPGISILVLLEVSRAVLERVKFGRLASYHLWSAKLWGIALWLGFTEAFLTREPGPLFRIAVGTGVLADLEGLCTSLVLSEWRHDLPTLWHALRVER